MQPLPRLPRKPSEVTDPKFLEPRQRAHSSRPQVLAYRPPRLLPQLYADQAAAGTRVLPAAAAATRRRARRPHRAPGKHAAEKRTPSVGVATINGPEAAATRNDRANANALQWSAWAPTAHTARATERITPPTPKGAPFLDDTIGTTEP